MFKKVIVAQDVYYSGDKIAPAFLYFTLGSDRTWQVKLKDNLSEATLFMVDSDDVVFFLQSVRTKFPNLKFCTAQVDTRVLPSPVTRIWEEIEMQPDVTRR